MYIEKDELLKRTNGGLDIIFMYYPDAQEAHMGRKKQFKIRNERTPSATLKQLSDGNWVVTDFGDDSQPRNGIQICQKEDRLEFREALAFLADKFGIAALAPEEKPKADVEFRPATPDEKDGEVYFSVKPEIPKHELEVLGPRVDNEHCKSLSYYSLYSFTRVKDRKAIVTKSNDRYPIFMLDRGEFKKIYQPFSEDKAYKFQYVGNRPKDYINGLSELKKAYEDYKKSQDNGVEEGQDYEKIPEAILASGERDALCVKSFGYFPLWMNSETAKLTYDNYRDITACVDELYLLPDIDTTGINSAVSLGVEFLDAKIIWLPESMRRFKDRRGKQRKDFRDYVELYPSKQAFRKLMDVAMPMRFWDMEMKEKGIKYHFNPEHAYHFLGCNGFRRMENKNLKDGYMLVHVNGHTVREIFPAEAKEYLQKFVKERFLPIDLRNMLHRTNQLSEASLAGLPKTELDFSDYTKESQFMHFVNATWEISKKGITEHRPGDIPRYVWHEEVIDHKVKVMPAPFEVKQNKANGTWDIAISSLDSLFFRYLINASRIHWRSELENKADKLNATDREKYLKENRYSIAGRLLEQDEAFEQKQHLINKIFALGYLLHRYKDPSKPWCVYAMDNKDGDINESHGGSGKSFCFKAPRMFMKSVVLSGRNPKLTENTHIYDRVTEHTDYVLIDDADPYLNFSYFFDAVTGDMVVNPKNNKSYEIPFKDAPKFCITTNYGLRNVDPSTERRILYCVFSDYYHTKSEKNDFRETRTIKDDIGKNLFLDYTEDEWNADINFFARCVQAYLTIAQKFDPPMENVLMRNLRIEMGDLFKEWADVYFSDEAQNRDKDLRRTEMWLDFCDKTGAGKNWSAKRFGQALKAWCRYNGHELNPEERGVNKDGRIIVRESMSGKTEEYFHIKTNPNTNEN